MGTVNQERLKFRIEARRTRLLRDFPDKFVYTTAHNLSKRFLLVTSNLIWGLYLFRDGIHATTEIHMIVKTIIDKVGW